MLGNNHGITHTIRIDSKVLDAVDSDDPSKSRSQAAEELRQVVRYDWQERETWGKYKVRCFRCNAQRGMGCKQRYTYPWHPCF